MGRREKKRKQQQRIERMNKEKKHGDKKGERGNYDLPKKENIELEKYYKGQSIVPDDEWNFFMETLRKPLPSTFRVTGFRSAAKDLLGIIKSDYINNLLGEEFAGEEGKEVLKSLKWYPDELAWQLDVDRKNLRKHELLKKLHEFLVQETESGNISRQEAVSMIPPLLLNVKPNHKVLDMCAAPGSKTAQIVEMLHADDSKTVPDGFVVANDMDNKRCYLMVHQIGRLNSSNYVIVNHNAAQMPHFKMVVEGKDEWVQYDRVLADVPCSGDGTIRKNPDIWKKWHPNSAHYLHSIQHRILKRGLELLAVGGRLVYSTCSLNPIEDEAVVLSLLKLSAGAVSLVDVGDQLPGLKTMQGLNSWKVMTKSGEWYTKFSDVPSKFHSFIHPNMFPPQTEEEQQKYALNRCHRLLPHHQNTGGFFVAVMEKTAPLPWIKSFRLAHNEVTNTDEQSVAAAQLSADKLSASSLTCQQENLTENHLLPPAVKCENAEITVENVSETPDECDDNGNKDLNDFVCEDLVYNIIDETKVDESVVNDQSAGNDKLRKRPRSEKSNNNPKKAKFQGHREDPFVFLSTADVIWPPIRDYYGVDEFPVDQMMVRSAEGKRRNLYFVSKSIRQLVEQNSERIKFVNLGVKILSRSESSSVPCDFRLVQDGIEYLHSYMTKRVVLVTGEDVLTILTQENPYIGRLTNSAAKQLRDIGEGSCVFKYSPSSESSGDPGQNVVAPSGPRCHVVICGWRGRTTCRSFLAKTARAHIVRLFGQELKTKDEIIAGKLAKQVAEAASQIENNGSISILKDSGSCSDSCIIAAVDGSDVDTNIVSNNENVGCVSIAPIIDTISDPNICANSSGSACDIDVARDSASCHS